MAAWNWRRTRAFARLENADELNRRVGDFVSGRTLDENLAFFEAAEITVGPVHDIESLAQDRHVLARGLLADYPDADMGLFPMHAVPCRMSDTPGAIRAPAPRLGQHTRDVLAEIGFAPEEIEAALSSGLAREAS